MGVLDRRQKRREEGKNERRRRREREALERRVEKIVVFIDAIEHAAKKASA